MDKNQEVAQLTKRLEAGEQIDELSARCAAAGLPRLGAQWLTGVATKQEVEEDLTV